MKKTVLLLFIIFGSYFAISKVIESKELIPEEAIRMRIIPNSNSEYDQSIKRKVKDKVERDVFVTLKDTKGVEDARKKLNESLPFIKQNVEKILGRENYTLGYTVNYGLNYFPEKEFRGVTYKAGNYESLVVTLGEGKGDNWWCVLFPPLCLVEAEESTNVEYKLFIEEMIDKYL